MGTQLSLPNRDELLQMNTKEINALLVDSVETNNIENVQTLYDLFPKLDLNMQAGRLLQIAASHNFPDILRFILKKGHGNVQLVDAFDAVSRNYTEIIEILAEHRINIHQNEDRLLTASVLSGNVRLLKFLLQHGSDPNANQQKALKTAWKVRNYPAVTILHKYGA
ncbi:MAG: ankyrin repeat domain-containing protein, partial [Sphingobacteriaceae bacterium]